MNLHSILLFISSTLIVYGIIKMKENRSERKKHKENLLDKRFHYLNDLKELITLRLTAQLLRVGDTDLKQSYLHVRPIFYSYYDTDLAELKLKMLKEYLDEDFEMDEFFILSHKHIEYRDRVSILFDLFTMSNAAEGMLEVRLNLLEQFSSDLKINPDDLIKIKKEFGVTC